MAEPSVTFFGPLDAVVGPYAEHVVLALLLLTFVTRKLANDRHRRQARDGGAEAMSRHPAHSVALWGLVLMSFYYLTLHHHSGIVLVSLVLGVFISDFFEFEARKVEAREDRRIERPKGALVAAGLALLYSAYLSVFFLFQPVWSQVV